MQYKNIHRAMFIERPNRFIAICKLYGEIVTVHVKNTGRCKELLVDNAEVFLEKADNQNRKTKYDLVAVKKGSRLINMDSQCPNKAVLEWLKNGGFVKNPSFVQSEKKFGNSRLDFYVENGEEKIYIEVKGVTLERDNIALFPDAPTLRGTKHLAELIKAKEEGFRAVVIFVIQMEGVHCFKPNDETDPLFSDELRRAKNYGVEVIAVDSKVRETSLVINKRIKVVL